MQLFKIPSPKRKFNVINHSFIACCLVSINLAQPSSAPTTGKTQSLVIMPV